MWKCATRTIKATLGNRISKNSTALTKKTPESKDFNILVKFVPTLVECFNRRYGFCKDTCGSYSKEKKGKKGPKENKGSFIGTFDNNFFEVLSWGGVFMVAYFLLQPLGHRRFFPTLDSLQKPPFALTSYERTLQYVIDSVGIKSYNSVLPEVKDISETRQTSDEQFTSSDNLRAKEEGFSKLEKAHQKVMGTLTNWMGTQYMQSGKHKEALEYFAQAAKEENPAGMFNLGICHEKGLGTSKNFKMAAELYQKAANLGHASAMYNLGVFYARGLGGIEPDVNHARELFRAAASLGQRDAVRALSLEKEVSPELSKSFGDEPERETFISDFINGSILQYSSDNCDSCRGGGDGGVKACFYSVEKGLDSTFGSDSGLELSPQNETEVFLA